MTRTKPDSGLAASSLRITRVISSASTTPRTRYVIIAARSATETPGRLWSGAWTELARSGWVRQVGRSAPAVGWAPSAGGVHMGGAVGAGDWLDSMGDLLGDG